MIVISHARVATPQSASATTLGDPSSTNAAVTENRTTLLVVPPDRAVGPGSAVLRR